MSNLEHDTQTAYLAVQITVENAAHRHLAEMRRYSRAYGLCNNFSNAPRYRDWLRSATRAEVLEFGAYVAQSPIAAAVRARRAAIRRTSDRVGGFVNVFGADWVD